MILLLLIGSCFNPSGAPGRQHVGGGGENTEGGAFCSFKSVQKSHYFTLFKE